MGFSEIIKEDLEKVINESKISGKVLVSSEYYLHIFNTKY
jgi:hypothetical protein